MNRFRLPFMLAAFSLLLLISSCKGLAPECTPANYEQEITDCENQGKIWDYELCRCN